jgi:hypothetical protein
MTNNKNNVGFVDKGVLCDSVPRTFRYMHTQVRPLGESLRIMCSPVGWSRPALFHAIFKRFVSTTEWRVM